MAKWKPSPDVQARVWAAADALEELGAVVTPSRETRMAEQAKRWDEERDMSDAPPWYEADSASAWASGWNAAVAAYVAELDERLAAEGS